MVIIVVMNSLLPILIGIAIVISAVFIYFIIQPRLNQPSNQKNNKSAIQTASKKLSQDPYNPQALQTLAGIYYQDKLWEKAFPLYKTLIDVSTSHPEISLGMVGLRTGICAVKTLKLQEAFKALAIARQSNPSGFEVNYYLGYSFYKNEEYEKAIPFLKKALSINKEFSEAYEILAISLYKHDLFRESLPYLKKALDLTPENKDLLFIFGEALQATGNADKALKIFIHLRSHPVYGAKASLAAGLLHASYGQQESAIQDYEIGLKHETATIEILTQIRYNLAQVYIKSGAIRDALNLLDEIRLNFPGYKDVDNLINVYKELNKNVILRDYLMAPSSDFISLCRKIVNVFYKNAHVKIHAIDANHDMAEIQTEIETDKWEDSVIFRLYRNTGTTGELFVREFHTRIRDLKVGRGICINAGTFSPEAKKFVEGRPIDLIGKTELLKVFTKLHR